MAASSPKSSGQSCYNLVTFCIDIASVGFAILPRISTFTSWLHFPWDQRLTAGELRYRSLIPRLHCVPSNLSPLFQSLALDSDARIADTFLLALSIACGLTVLGRGFKIRKRPWLNRKYFNKAMIASVLCYNGTIYVGQKFSQMRKFCGETLWFRLNSEILEI